MNVQVEGRKALDLEGAIGSGFVNMDAPEAARHALRHFGVQGRLTRFATEKDDTFRIDGEDGRRHVLKVANPREAHAELDFQTRLLEHIAAVDPGLPVPRVRSAQNGEAIVTITDDAGQDRYMHLLAYLEGTPLEHVPTQAAQREALGAVLARLRLATADFAHPADGRAIAWDIQHLPELGGLLDEVADPGRRAALGEGFARFGALVPRVRALRQQVLHNDFNASNTVVDPAQPGFVTGIIDFGDAVRTAVAIDVSTALLAQLPRDMAQHPDQDMFAHARDLLRGYLAVAALTDEERALLPHLVMGRIVARGLITLWRAARMPHNATYVLRNTEPGWGQLDWFLRRSPDAVSAVFS